jgi:NodT family efflux transporter outer membrane factor (OMF) lipoprotein
MSMSARNSNYIHLSCHAQSQIAMKLIWKRKKTINFAARVKCYVAACWRLGAALLLLLSGCAVGPDFVHPNPPNLQHYTKQGQPTDTVAEGQRQTFILKKTVAADWWRMFNSDELNRAVEEAVRNNANLASAQASLRQSQDILKAGYGVFYPSIGLGFSAERQKTSLLRIGVNAVSGVFNLFTLSTAISYSLDVFGGNRRTVEALAAQTDYQQYALLATYLTLTGNVVNTLIARAAYQAQIQATEELIARQKEQLAIAQAQVLAGTAAYASVLSIQSQIAANEAMIPTLRQKADQAEHLLATLVGRAPAEFNAPAIDIAGFTLPQQLPLSLPSDLVRQRPDILAAESQLHIASANIGVATAPLFPSFNINGSYGVNSTTMGNLTNSNNAFWSVGPAVNFPLFQGGATWYQRNAAMEAYQKSLADYRQTVLNAFAQVADTLNALEHDAQSLQAQADALHAAEQALNLLQANYRAGIVGYLDVLVANVQFYQAKINYLQALAQRYQDTTALFLALGGGWWNTSALGGPLPGKQE